jgi:hypothetical protein
MSIFSASIAVGITTAMRPEIFGRIASLDDMRYNFFASVFESTGGQETMQKVSPAFPHDAVLDRIEAITRELEDLRRLILEISSTPASNNFTDDLLGSLGSESITAYDYDLDWERFNTQ